MVGIHGHPRYQRCAGKCAINTAADEAVCLFRRRVHEFSLRKSHNHEVVFQTKHNISMPEMKDLETQALSWLLVCLFKGSEGGVLTSCRRW